MGHYLFCYWCVCISVTGLRQEKVYQCTLWHMRYMYNFDIEKIML